MHAHRWTKGVAALFLCVSIVHGKSIDDVDPLFQSDDILDVRIVAPISEIMSERSTEDELPGTLEYTNSAGQAVVLDVEVRTRGRFRRRKDVCRFPPLRLNFKTSETKGTLFHKQDKVKLVTHCQSSNSYEQVVLREYNAYRIMNILSGISFRVRLLRVSYVESKSNKVRFERYGFLIEHRDRLGKRLEKPIAATSKTKVGQLDPAYLNLTSMYHYFIGNTDFSPIMGAEENICCHNHILFGSEGEVYVSVPYDFDQSGLVNAAYASPDPRFKIRSVRQRLYRGRCVNNNRLEATIAVFQDKREDIYALIESDARLSKGSRKSMRKFIDRFYQDIESERRVNSAFVKECI